MGPPPRQLTHGVRRGVKQIRKEMCHRGGSETENERGFGNESGLKHFLRGEGLRGEVHLPMINKKMIMSSEREKDRESYSMKRLLRRIAP